MIVHVGLPGLFLCHVYDTVMVKTFATKKLRSDDVALVF